MADLDDPLSRLEIGPGSVSLFGGPPGAGKTALVMQLVFEAVRLTTSLKAVVCNVEMAPTALLERQLARLSGVTLADLRHRRVGSHNRDALATRVATLRPSSHVWPSSARRTT